MGADSSNRGMPRLRFVHVLSVLLVGLVARRAVCQVPAGFDNYEEYEAWSAEQRAEWVKDMGALLCSRPCVAGKRSFVKCLDTYSRVHCARTEQALPGPHLSVLTTMNPYYPVNHRYPIQKSLRFSTLRKG
jgi:hypothetical protein